MKFERPIAIFAFKRPTHLEQVLKVVKTINPRKVYFYVDRPKSSASPKVVADWESVLNLINSIDWIEVKKVEIASQNLGCKLRISSGIEDVLKKEDSAIFLEDDCLPDLSFFYYCDFFLNHFNNDEEVMMISGFNPLNSFENGYDVLFSDYPHIWGWATWSRFLKIYDSDMLDWTNKRKLISNHPRLTIKEKKFWNYFFKKVFKGKVDTWDAQVTFASIVNNKMTLYPTKSLVRNIGFDDNGTHVKAENKLSKVITHTLIAPYKIGNKNVDFDFDRQRAEIEYSLPSFELRVLQKLRSFLQ